MSGKDYSDSFTEAEVWMQLFDEIHQTLKEECDFDLPFDVFHKIGMALVPERASSVFERKPCRRKLKYIGYDNWDEPDRSEFNATGDDYFEYGKIYYSTDFNGGTYSIEGYSEANDGRVIGCAYFKWIRECR